MRAVEAALGEFHKESIPRGELVAVHGNRFILHRVFMDPLVKAYKDPNMTEQQIAELASASTADVLTKLAYLISKLYSAAYLANLFKNVQKNKDLDKRMAEADIPPVGETMNMFDPKSE